jgi:hypothetical protein
VKIAIVAGFYDRVKIALDERYPEEIYRDRLIWISAGSGALAIFKERFYDVVKMAEGLLVCLGRAGSQRYLEDAMRGIVRVAQAQYATPIHFEAFGNLYDPGPVVELVKSFGLEAEGLICTGRIRSKIIEGKILCVSIQGKTSILASLQRAGFSDEAIRECFDEEIRKGGRNSNLMQELKSRAASYSCLLYAWAGLRTSDQDVKNAYRFGCHEACSASQVVELFKSWITDSK